MAARRSKPGRPPAAVPANTTPPTAIPPPRDERLRLGVLLGVLALMFVPFLGRAFHMDDPLFLWAAKYIQTNPWNPYDLIVNWYGTEQPMSAVMENPPLASYVLALVGLVAGLTEVPVHVAFLLPALLCAFGMYLVARRFCRDAVTAVA